MVRFRFIRKKQGDLKLLLMTVIASLTLLGPAVPRPVLLSGHHIK